MKLFKQGAEMRLTQDDLKDLLEAILNQKIFFASKHTVVNLSLHPGNKYVARVTFKSE